MADVKNDAEKLDKILSHLDSASEKMDAFSKRLDSIEAKADASCTRMDAFEKARADSEEKEKEEKAKADAAKKDADEKEAKAKADAEEEKAKADKARKDAEEEEAKKKADAARADSTADLRAQIDALTRRLPADLPADARQKMVGHQAKAERVAQAFGDSVGAPTFVNGESEHDYRVRLLTKYKVHSKTYKDSDLSKVQDAAIFDSVEASIYADAYAAAMHPTDIPVNVLLPRVTQDATGRKITSFVGSPGSCWNRFKMPYRFVKGWGDPKTGKMQTVF
jgi:hypothetical protein